MLTLRGWRKLQVQLRQITIIAKNSLKVSLVPNVSGLQTSCGYGMSGYCKPLWLVLVSAVGMHRVGMEMHLTFSMAYLFGSLSISSFPGNITGRVELLAPAHHPHRFLLIINEACAPCPLVSHWLWMFRRLRAWHLFRRIHRSSATSA